MTLDLPLFPGYVFVRLALCDRLRVLQIPSVVRLVGINGHPAPLPDDEIEALRNGLAHRRRRISRHDQYRHKEQDEAGEKSAEDERDVGRLFVHGS